MKGKRGNTAGKKTLYKAECSQCGAVMRAYTRSELLSKLRKHLWKFHRGWMIARIKAGRMSAQQHNPSFQDIIRSLKTGVKAAFNVIGFADRATYRQLKPVMDTLEGYLPPDMMIVWRAVEALMETRYPSLKKGK